MLDRVRIVPRLARLFWEVDPFRATLLLALGLVLGLVPLAQVHALRGLVETAQMVVNGSAPIAAGLAWGVVLGAVSLLEGGIRQVVLALRGSFGEILRAAMHERVYRHLHALPLAEFELPDRHDQLQRVRQGLEQRLLSTVLLLFSWVSNAAAVAALLVYLAHFHWGLAAVLCAGTLPGLLVHHRYLVWRFLTERGQTAQERRFGVLRGLLTGRPAAAEIRLFGLGPWLLEESARLWEPIQRRQLAFAARFGRSRLAADGVNVIAYVLTLAFGVWLVAEGRVTLGVAAALFTAIERFQAGARFLLDEAVSAYADLRYVQEYFDLIDAPCPQRPGGHRVPPGPLRHGIALEGVSFQYPGGGELALRDVDLVIRPGERIALVGENGAGKTTLAKLLMGLYAPTAGCVLADGVDLQEVDPAEWHRRVGAVFQDFQRYQATIRENIALGAVERLHDQASLAEAAVQSGAGEVAATLPNGLDTALGKEFHDGHDLSVGQWQKLAIARAYLRAPEILILDEPASALDARAEAGVYEQFARMAAGRMVVLISHRLGSCRLAHRIVVLKGGRIVEEGTHVALLAAGGEYAQTYNLQAAWYR